MLWHGKVWGALVVNLTDEYFSTIENKNISEYTEVNWGFKWTDDDELSLRSHLLE